MKKFLILLLLFFIPEVKAQETWVKVGQSMFYGIPGSLAYEMCTKDNFCGMGYFIDVRSLVERGNFRYFNLDVSGLNKNGFKSSNKQHGGNGWKVDCENNLLGTQINLKEPTASPEFDVINFVCSSNKTDSSNKVDSQWRKYGDFFIHWKGITLDEDYLSDYGYITYDSKIEKNGILEKKPFSVRCDRQKVFNWDKKSWFSPKNEFKKSILNDICNLKIGDPEIVPLLKDNSWKQYSKNLWVNHNGWGKVDNPNNEETLDDNYGTQIYNSSDYGKDVINISCSDNQIAFLLYGKWGDWNDATGINKKILNDGCNF